MIDFLLIGLDKPSMITWLTLEGLMVNGLPKEGVDITVWPNDGKIISKDVVRDVEGEVIAPAEYLSGFAMIVRFFGQFYLNDKLTSNDPHPWAKSKFVAAVRTRGSNGNIKPPGTNKPIFYSEYNGVRVFRIKNKSAAVPNNITDFTDWLTTMNLPHHEWFGGNQT